MPESLTETPTALPTIPTAPSVEPPEAMITVIEPISGWRLIDWKELVKYRDLFRFLVRRSIRVRYAQSTLGIGWAVMQPLANMLVFTVVFGRLADVPSDGVPYALFSLVALVPWLYFSNALTAGTSSLVSNANMLRKIYFPRLLLPASEVCAKLVDFVIGLGMLAALMLAYGVAPGWGALTLPLLILIMALTAVGASSWLTALAVQYRDVNYAMTFLVQMLMYATPVVYPASLVPERYRLIYGMNPMVGVIEGFRSALLGTRPMPWDFLAIGGAVSVALAMSGLLYFRRKERLFADVA